MVSPDNPLLFSLWLAGMILLALASWSLIMLVSGRLSGWSRLAQDYRSDDPMPSMRFRFQTVWLRGWTHYANCITFGVDHRGLHLASFVPLLGHPRLLIPWSDVSVTPKKIWWLRRAELRFRRAPEIPVRIRARLAAKISSAAASYWHTESALLERPSAEISPLHS